nr:accessory protein [Pohorje myodes paramyxovirus 1]
MESKLSSLYNRLRRTLRRHTGEVPSRNQEPRIESKPGKESQQTMITQETNRMECLERRRELRKERAKEVLRIIEELEMKRILSRENPQPPPRLVISRIGMLKILLMSVQKTGEIPVLDYISLERAQILDQMEIQSLREAWVMTQSVMRITV